MIIHGIVDTKQQKYTVKVMNFHNFSGNNIKPRSKYSSAILH